MMALALKLGLDKVGVFKILAPAVLGSTPSQPGASTLANFSSIFSKPFLPLPFWLKEIISLTRTR